MIIDGLQCTRFDSRALEHMRSGGVTCVTATLGFWEDTLETLDAVGRYADLGRDPESGYLIVRTAADIRAAEGLGKVGILPGVQNSCALAGRVRFVEIFSQVGVRVVQLTYNTQNDIGGSCYDAEDSGLTRFGREVVAEMNRCGMVVDLSHVGDRTSREVIEASQMPVAFTHANPSSLAPHPRNKPDDLLRALAERGGMVGLAVYHNICGEYGKSCERWCEMVARTVELCGIDHVGIGTDIGEGGTIADIEWMRQGRWTRSAGVGASTTLKKPEEAEDRGWFSTNAHFSLIAAGLAARGFSSAEVDAVMGGNWLRFYDQVLPPA